MSRETPAPESEHGPTDDRYVAIDVGDRDTLVYDRESPTAWIRADVAVSPTSKT